MAEISGDKAYLSGENFLTTIRHGATPYISVQVELKGAGLDLRREVGALDPDVSFLQSAPRGVSGALSQAIKCRDKVLDDKGEVRTEIAKQDANGTDQ